MLIRTGLLGPTEQRAARRRFQTGELIRLRAGIFVDAVSFRYLPSWERYRLRCLAVGISRPGDVLVGKSAAAMWRIPHGRVPDRVEIARSGGGGVADKTLLHRVLAPSFPTLPAVTPVGTAQVSDLPQTLIDVARWHRLPEAVAAMDHCLHHRMISPESLAEAAALMAGRTGIHQATTALKLARAAAESPRESEIRVGMWQDGLPAPHLQGDIRDVRGEFVGRVDLLFPDHSVGVEYDGEAKYQGVFGLRPEMVIQDEMRRQKELLNAGVHLVRVTAETYREGTWLEHVKQALEVGEGRVLPAARWSTKGLAWD